MHATKESRQGQQPHLQSSSPGVRGSKWPAMHLVSASVEVADVTPAMLWLMLSSLLVHRPLQRLTRGTPGVSSPSWRWTRHRSWPGGMRPPQAASGARPGAAACGSQQLSMQQHGTMLVLACVHVYAWQLLYWSRQPQRCAAVGYLDDGEGGLLEPGCLLLWHPRLQAVNAALEVVVCEARPAGHCAARMLAELCKQLDAGPCAGMDLKRQHRYVSRPRFRI